MTEEVQKYVVVGNGFDLNLGIKSSYGDFVEYIKSREGFKNDAELSEYNRLFQKRERFGTANWSGFESELEKRTFELQTWNSSTSDSMNPYVQMAELNAAITQLEQEFYMYLSEQLLEWQEKYPEPYVTHEYKKIFDGSVVINFNYTDSPNILGLVDVNYYYSVHGSLKNNDIIFGGGFVGHEKSRTVWVPESFKNDKLVRVKQNAYLAEERAKLIDNINHSKKFDLYILGHSLVGTDLLFLETLLVGARRIYLYYHQEDYLPKIEELIKKYDRDMIEKIILVPFTKIISDKEGDLMKTNNNIPAYRFQGYTDAWKQRKLGEYFVERLECSAEGELLSVTISDGVRRFSELGRKDNSSEDKTKYKVLKQGDIVYNSMRMWQGASGYSIYDGIVSPAYTVLIPTYLSYALFFSYLFKRSSSLQIFQVNSQGLTSDTWNLKYKPFSNIVFPAPTHPEQSAIGTFFSTLDRHITLHQRKLDTLKEQKKTYLKFLFPAKGQTKPALRFQGFEDDWEEVKLGEVAKMYQPQTITGGDLIEEGIPVFGANGYIGYYSDCNHVTDQVTISARGEGTGTPNFVKAPVWITGNSMVINVDENMDIDKKFLYSNFLAYDFKKYVSGGAQPQLTRDVLSLVIISLPSLLEQEAIGTFFQNLDQEIAQVEDKLASLKEMKKTLLRKLFV